MAYNLKSKIEGRWEVEIEGLGAATLNLGNHFLPIEAALEAALRFIHEQQSKPLPAMLVELITVDDVSKIIKARFKSPPKITYT